MNIDSLLKERKDLAAQLNHMNILARDITFLRHGCGGSTTNLFVYNSAPVFEEIKCIFRRAMLDSVAMAEHRLSEIEETLTAINTLLSGCKQ